MSLSTLCINQSIIILDIMKGVSRSAAVVFGGLVAVPFEEFGAGVVDDSYLFFLI